jgi:hypothetical protein
MWTWPVVLSTSLAAVALVVSVAALGWQVVSWRRSGPRIEVAARAAVTPNQRLIVIEAKNSGRLGTEIQTCGFDLPSGRHIVCPFDFQGVPLALPAQLPAGGKVSFYFRPDDVLQPLTGEGVTGENTRVYVATGHGRFRGEPFHLGEMLKPLIQPYGFRKRRSQGSA